MDGVGNKNAKKKETLNKQKYTPERRSRWRNDVVALNAEPQLKTLSLLHHAKKLWIKADAIMIKAIVHMEIKENNLYLKQLESRSDQMQCSDCAFNIWISWLLPTQIIAFQLI